MKKHVNYWQKRLEEEMFSMTRDLSCLLFWKLFIWFVFPAIFRDDLEILLTFWCLSGVLTIADSKGETSCFSCLCVPNIRYSGINCLPVVTLGWDSEIDIQKTIQLVRAQRSGMVQTEVRFFFFQCYFLCGDYMFPLTNSNSISLSTWLSSTMWSLSRLWCR